MDINDKNIYGNYLDCYRWYLYLHWTGQSPGHSMMVSPHDTALALAQVLQTFTTGQGT